MQEIRAHALLENVDIDIDELIETAAFGGVAYLSYHGLNFISLLFGSKTQEQLEEIGWPAMLIATAPLTFVIWWQAGFPWPGRPEDVPETPDPSEEGVTREGIITTRTIELKSHMPQDEFTKMVDEYIEEAKIELLEMKKTIVNNIKLYDETIKRDEDRIHDIGVTINGGIRTNGSEVTTEQSLLYAMQQASIRGDHIEADRLHKLIRELERIQQMLDATINGGWYTKADGSDHEVTTGRRQAIVLLEEQKRMMVETILRDVITKEQADNIKDKINWHNIYLAVGAAGLAKWYLTGRIRTGETVTPEV